PFADSRAMRPSRSRRPSPLQLAGAIHFEADETGDAYRFCVALTDHARQQGVDFRFRTQVSSLDVRSGQVTAAVTARVAAAGTGRERQVADAYVVAAGSYSTALLKAGGVCIPVQPVKRYSTTVPLRF